jgi:hypothetical protein
MLTKEDKNKFEKEIEKLKKQESQNLELLRKLSSLTQILLEATMENINTKENVKKHIVDILSDKVNVGHLKLPSLSQ